MKQLAAVLGVGQTRHRSKRTDVSIAGLCREAVDRALEDAQVARTDIDAVVGVVATTTLRCARQTAATADFRGGR